MHKLILACLVGCVLVGCGQKGPLILPEQDSKKDQPAVKTSQLTYKEHYVAI